MGRYSLQGIIYTVRGGDSIYSISRRYNVGVAAISRENPLIDIYNLSVGDEIQIPVDLSVTNQLLEYQVISDETIQSILTKFGIDLDEFLKYNDLKSLKLQQGMMLHIPTKMYNHKSL